MRTSYSFSALVGLSGVVSVACSPANPGTDVTVTDAVDVSSIDTVTPDTVVADVPSDTAPTPVDATPVDAGDTWCSVARPVADAVLPAGFCMRLFVGSTDGSGAHSPLKEPRNMTFAPNGDLFVAAPSTTAAGGASGGPGAILVLSDDDRDGTAEIHTFLAGLPDVHGLTLGPDAVYYTTANTVWRTPYTAGQRAATAGAATTVATITNPGRWTHGLARSVGGSLYVSNGVLAANCPEDNVGYVASVTQGNAPTRLARGLRNPMSLRCHFRDETCFATEMGDDGGASYGAREKMFRIRADTNYGFPCCAGPGMPRPGVTTCSGLTQEEATFALTTSPFGFDWERGVWPAPYNDIVCVALHGSFYSTPPWAGEGVVCAPTDATTHVPTGPFTEFANGFSPSHVATGHLERPADIAFSAGGRMFIADDLGNAIYFVAPTALPRTAY